MEDVRMFIEESLSRVLVEVLVEGKSPTQWWDKLKAADRKKVVDILGLGKGKEKSSFSKLDDDEQSEITAYFRKYKGVVEDLGDDDPAA